MKQKSILIFGAGINQLTLIRACNNLGHCSVVIDPNHDAPGKRFADVFHIVEQDDYNTTKEIADKYTVAGVPAKQIN